MGQLEQMRVFVRIVEAGGITRAAQQLNMAKSMVSRRLSQLEEQLGTALLHRTTRRLTLTDAGQQYYQRSIGIIDEIDELNQNTRRSRSQIAGPIHLAAPLTFGTMHLSPAVDEFLQMYPEIRLQISLSDSRHQLVEQGIDLALRIAHLDDSSLRARRLTDIRFVACAAPTYLEKFGCPKRLSQLKEHRILHYSLRPNMSWSFYQHGEPVLIRYHPYLSADNGEILRNLAIAGQGIAVIPTFIGWQSIINGQLEIVLGDYELEKLSAWLVYPNAHYQPQRLRTFIDFLVQRFADCPYWDQALVDYLQNKPAPKMCN
ncbi:LysR family transcriptional regulator [Celerinatantimonas sp. YJH-8]|uniref:LysR family transcriptional regulator n=1 Tax=Celerinatantimonas sp. YJH-8 TaxID=3228714 RepID=UPI0038C2D9EB